MRRVPAILFFAVSLALMLPAQEASTAKEKEWRAAIQQLGARTFAVREAAQQTLVRAGGEHTEALLDLATAAWPDTRDLEVRLRLRQVIERVVQDHIYDQPAGYLGILMQSGRSLHERKTVGVIEVVEVKENSPAEKAGFRAGDEIFEADGKRFAKDVRNNALIELLQTKRPGREIELGILRDFKPKTFRVTLGKSPNLRKQTEKLNFRQFFANWWRAHVDEPGEERDGTGSEP